MATGLNFGPLCQRAPQLGVWRVDDVALVGPPPEKSFRLSCLAIAANKRIFVTAAATWGLFFMV